jgi:hypothetical protein
MLYSLIGGNKLSFETLVTIYKTTWCYKPQTTIDNEDDDGLDL